MTATPQQSPARTPGPDGPRTSSPAGAPAPTGAPPATGWAVLLGLLVTALGVLLLRDAAVLAGLLDGTAVTSSLVEKLRSVRPQAWYVPAGVVLALLGLWVVVVAVRPRPRRDLAVGDRSLVWLTPSAVAGIARSAASGVDGVVEARATATRRAVRVLARTTSTDPGVAAGITEAVEHSLSGLASTPTVRVTTRAIGDHS